MTKPAPPYFPYTEHRTMAQVDHDEARERLFKMPPSERLGMTVASCLNVDGDVR